MAATRDDLRAWFLRGQQEETLTHMVILCDTFDMSDYPVYVESKERALEYMGTTILPEGHKVMEVYNLHRDMEEQLAAYRAWYF
jgi:hypothetical protein